MKKFTLLLMSLLMVSSLAFAQKKLCVHKLDGSKLEVLASEVSYIDFEGVATDPDDDPVVPGTSAFVAKPFSVSDSKTVKFSPGNLQYHPANDEWRFAPNQTDYIGEDNASISSTYNGWIDLFGWGTGNNPTNVSTDYHDYQTFVDWGVNKIGNYSPNTWRTLTYDEWSYLYNYRSNADKLIGVAQVNGVNGLILLPDNWTCPSGVTFKSGFHYDSGTEYYAEYQTFSASEWAKLEASGAVFFPAAGLGLPQISSVSSVQDDGFYWSATESAYDDAHYLYFSSDEAEHEYKNFRIRGLSVRLVQEDPIERKLYFVNKEGWTDVKAYIWSSEDGKYNIAWPGQSVYKEDYRIIGYEVYSYGMSDKQSYDMIIFNGLATSTSTVLSQTSDLEIDYSKPYYYDGIWFSSLDDIIDKAELSGYHNGYQYVDLGLPSGIKWATMNVGADSPEDYGDYFAWGETKPKASYDLETYKWCNGSYDTQTKYCTDSDDGKVDNKTILELSDDAANANWGGYWRMPTKAEQDELRTECTWTWTTQNGVDGYKVTSKTIGNSIFLPAAGYRYHSDLSNAGYYSSYWSSSLYTSDSSKACELYFYSHIVSWLGSSRYYGRSVRPVLAK